jgi:glycosyltransferase involved in cell wall biosynthesis
MHILLVADGRSPITLHWIQGLQALQHEITLVSTYPCLPVQGLKGLHVLPVAFAGQGGSQAGAGQGRPSGGGKRALVSRMRGLFQAGRYLLGPLTLPYYARQLERIAAEAKPDLVHALRIPFEGMLAASAKTGLPTAVTIWGNDLSLHAGQTPLMRSLTLQTLRRANGLAADVERDIRMGCLWGFASDRPTLVVPGNGGVDFDEINRVNNQYTDILSRQLPAGVPLIVNPRGLRPGYVRNDVFFESIPLVLQHRPDAFFVCCSMAGQPEALAWIQRLKIGHAVRLLAYLPQPQLWDLFQRAEITVSVSTHDGTPNTLLEAMACGCFPVAGDLESIREWITPGVNGLLVEPNKPQGLAQALLLALAKPELRLAAAATNRTMVRQRAVVDLVRAKMEGFYQSLLV